MIRPDVLVTWPRNVDYPLWRQMIRDERRRFNSVLIVFMNPNYGYDYREFVKEAMKDDGVFFSDSPEPVGAEDWRNLAVNHGISQSFNSHIWFTEQDFYPLNSFWQWVEKYEDKDVIGVKDNTRLHPCSLILNNKALDTISCDFSVQEGLGDHFSLVQKEIEESNLTVGIISPKWYIHMNGLSHNFALISKGEMPNYKPMQFRSYIIKTLQTKVPINDEYRAICAKFLKSSNDL